VITVDFQKLDIAAGNIILDVGCGTGRHTCGALKYTDVTVLGVDVHLNELIESRKKLELQAVMGQVCGKWEICVADICRLPFEPNRFDAVICSEVLEHIPEHRQAISEIVRVLKPGKKLALSVPRYLPERVCWFLSKKYRTAPGGHVRIYRQKELIALMESAGANLRNVHWAHSLHSPYWWLKCLVGPACEPAAVRCYHRFLVWDMMKRPGLTRFAEKLLDPLLGKSLVLYFQKNRMNKRHETAPRNLLF